MTGSEGGARAHREAAEFAMARDAATLTGKRSVVVTEVRGSVLLVGESNPHSSRPEDALLPWPAGAAGDRLAGILGMSHHRYLATFARRNLDAQRSSTGRWSAPAAREAAKALVAERPAAVVALGRRVTVAFWDALGRATPDPGELSLGALLDLARGGLVGYPVPEPFGTAELLCVTTLVRVPFRCSTT